MKKTKSTIKNVVILGAAGRTGRLLVDEALKAGYKVTAFVRQGEKVPARDNLVVVEGDARNVDDLKFALGGQDAVISTLGSAKLHDDLITVTTDALVKAANANKVKRVIMMSSFVVSGQLKQNPLNWIFTKLFEPVIGDKSSGEKRLKASKLDWTIVYCTRLSDGPATNEVHIVPPTLKVSPVNTIKRADVAKFLVNEVATTSRIRESVLITTK